MSESTQAPWWKGATIYQIYPRSFADSDGDGIGDRTVIFLFFNKLGEIVEAAWIQ